MTVGGIQVLPEESLLGDWPPSHHLNKRKHTDHGAFVGYSGTKIGKVIICSHRDYYMKKKLLCMPNGIILLVNSLCTNTNKLHSECKMCNFEVPLKMGWRW